MEVEGVVIDSYFLKSDFTDHEIRLILNTQLFNGRREHISYKITTLGRLILKKIGEDINE